MNKHISYIKQSLFGFRSSTLRKSPSGDRFKIYIPYAGQTITCKSNTNIPLQYCTFENCLIVSALSFIDNVCACVYSNLSCARPNSRTVKHIKSCIFNEFYFLQICSSMGKYGLIDCRTIITY